MTIEYNVTGHQRKELVTAISEITGECAVYQGAPSFAYNIGSYVVDKTGTLTGEMPQELLDRLTERGFTIPKNSDNLQDLHEPQASDESYDVTKLEETDALGVILENDGFTDMAISNIEKMVESKATLIRNAIGQNLVEGLDGLPILITDTNLHFPWFRTDTSQEEMEAYTLFILALCSKAKEQKRVTAKEKDVDNEKYAFRCFLLRLGFIGAEYKSVRKILLANLSGNGAHKSGDGKPQEPSVSYEQTVEKCSEEDLAEALADAQLIYEVNELIETSDE